jgi:hypothetical protein
MKIQRLKDMLPKEIEQRRGDEVSLLNSSGQTSEILQNT